MKLTPILIIGGRGGGLHLSIKSMLCFVLSLIATCQVTLEIGSLSKVASIILAPFLEECLLFHYPHSRYVLGSILWVPDRSYGYLFVLS